MAANKTNYIDFLIEECSDLEKCKAVLEDLYYICGAIEIAVECLVSRHESVGQKFKTLEAAVKNWKACLSGHMKFVRLYNHQAQKGCERLQNLVKDHPEMVEEINDLGNVLFVYARDLKMVIKQAAMTCKVFEDTGRMVLDFLMNQEMAMD